MIEFVQIFLLVLTVYFGMYIYLVRRETFFKRRESNPYPPLPQIWIGRTGTLCSFGPNGETSKTMFHLSYKKKFPPAPPPPRKNN